METLTLVQAILLGIVEGATEFIPVSSTGHLILAGKLLGAEGNTAEVFEVVIQLGAILAICVLYFSKLWSVLVGLPNKPEAQRFALAVTTAFVPSALLGLLLHDFIKQVLFSPWVVCVALLLGGIAILVVEKTRTATSSVHAVEEFSLMTALKIGLFQCLAMVPGVSRSGATIIGGLLVGVDRKTAAEFSFFLAIPTMIGASGLDLWKSRHLLRVEDVQMIGVGFVVSFIVALLVVKWLVGFVSRRGFVPFAWYRIAAGLFGLLLLTLGYGV